MSFEVIEGGGSIVAQLEDVLELARDGKIEGVVISLVRADGITGGRYAYHPEMDFPWSRLIAAVEHSKNQMLTQGV